MPKVKCLRRLANTLAGSTIVTEKDDTICKVLNKMATNLRYIPDDSTLLHDVSDVVFPVTVTQTDQTYVCDKTFEQIQEAMTAGKIVVCKFGVMYLYPSQTTSAVCQFYADAMTSSTECQRTIIAINTASVNVMNINYVLTPPDSNDPPAA